MKSTHQQLINDIQNLLNRYDGHASTSINPALLDFMDRETLLDIITDVTQSPKATKAMLLRIIEVSIRSFYKSA